MHTMPNAADRTVLFRFLGRFVFAEPSRPDGTLSAIAVDVSYCRDVNAGCHKVVMSVPWGKVSSLGSTPPDEMFVSSASADPARDQLERIQQGVWDLEGRVLTVPGADTFSWQDKSSLVTFDRLAPGTPISSSAATSIGGPTAAIVRVRGGVGLARQMRSELLNLVPLKLANQSSNDPPERLADVVEIAVTTTPDPFVIEMASDGLGSPGAVIVTTEPGRPTVVTFSNLCTRTSFEDFDAELAALYEVLEQPPPTRERLVPRRVDTLNGRIDCHTPIAGSF
jgi:hypothetical protein